MRQFKTCGKVRTHAIDRIRDEYCSPASEKEIRRALREDLKASRENNGWALISPKTINKLKMKVPVDAIMVAVVAKGEIVTIFDRKDMEKQTNGRLFSPRNFFKVNNIRQACL
ncbi:MAG: hypothetical protein QMD86_02695 [Patescibacteria group bacterium]|nr:hypothetical protein [Patescibacteria group bacterium]